MKFKKASASLFALLGLFLFSPAHAVAEVTNPYQEVTLGTGNFIFGGGHTTIDVNLGYRYLVVPASGLQAGLDLGANFKDPGASVTYNIFPTVRYNVAGSEELSSSFFVDLGAGVNITNSNSTKSESRMVFGGGVGRRFDIASNVSWTPRVLVRKVEKADVDFLVTPIAISLFY